MISAEAKVLILNAVVLGVAYLGIYPTMREKTLKAMLRNDLALTLLLIVTAGALFAGSGTRFGLIVTDTNWFAFTLLTSAAMELPLFLWFCRKHDIDMTGGAR
ncbi:hypothetical protein [Paracoccus sp. S1E-3]|uniref:hypothetical protein n=1 Tax=Paracoccus sp. S1E-3 TaxID=2756130 RepID=UPI0015EF8A6D|nr:hypothetical protein [Paracoccus sp. S1E-3]MBA4492169.1 hypothetical protein [Paracoccus sp. S1E-3]